MTTLVVVSLATTIAGGPSQLSTERFAIPDSRLPTGCHLSVPESDRVRNRSGTNLGLSMPTNPWSGADSRLRATVRERLVSPVRLPDGPPLSGAELARFNASLVEDVVEAYAAIYRDATGHDATVYALRFVDGRMPKLRAAPAGGFRFLGDDSVIVVAGGGACADAIGAYVARAQQP